MLIKLLFSYLLLPLLPVYAHVGSPGVVLQGIAGPYKVLVSVKPPDVIPGIASVTVYLQDVPTAVSARPLYFRTGTEGAPPSDEMKPVSDKPGQYTVDLWMMSGGSASIQVQVQGSKGRGELIVPVLSIATAKKELPVATGYGLAAAGILLFLLLVAIIGAAVSDSMARRGEELLPQMKRKRMKTIGIATGIVLLLLLGGYSWVAGFAENYTRFLYQPTKATVSVSSINGANELRLQLDTSEDSQRKDLFSYLVPDHGKLMHLFVMRIPAMDAFAHLHPVRVGSSGFRTMLPGLPTGKYLLFADIAYVSVFTETIRDTFEITARTIDSLQQLDRDDAFAFALRSDVIDNPQLVNPADNIICGKPGKGVKMKDGSTMVWQEMGDEPLETNKLYNLRFAVLDAKRQPAVLQPYLGMGGHAAIVRNDGNVYMHLHPMGTASMAAETNFASRISHTIGEYQYPNPQKFQDSINGYIKALSAMNDSLQEATLMQQMQMPETKAGNMAGMAHSNVVEFPYAFPSPGQYRIWVQVKRNGQVLTAAFDKMVE